MDLLVLRHGIAADRERWTGADADRPLTPGGKRRTREVVRMLARHYQPQAIWSSPWRRARETAEIAGRVWKREVVLQGVLAGDGGAPDAVVRGLLAARASRLMIVGHEPDLGELVGHLIGSAPIPLKKSGLAVLRGPLAAAAMDLRALLHPSVVLDLGTQD